MVKKILSALIASAIVLGTMCFTVFADETDNWIDSADTEWYNNSSTEFTISTAAELAGLAKLVTDGTDTFANKKITLGADIDLSGKEWTPIGGYDAAHYFGGEFDGASRTVSNVTINKTNAANDKLRLGFFAQIQGTTYGTPDGYVHNLTLKNVVINTDGITNTSAGGLVANLWSYCEVKNVTVDGYSYTNNAEYTGDYYFVGGLAGTIATNSVNNKIENNLVKDVNITINGAAHAGGVSGYNQQWLSFLNTDVENVTITANNSGSKEAYIGGFFGDDAFNNGYDYEDCDVSGVEITLNGTGTFCAGGFGGCGLGGSVWNTEENVKNCSAAGAITNNGTSEKAYLGGFYGEGGYGARTYSGSSANVNISSSAGISGGFVGLLASPQALQSFKDCTVSGSVSGKIAGGFIGKIDTDDESHTDHLERVTIYKNCVNSSDVTGTVVKNDIANVQKNHCIDAVSENSEKYEFINAEANAYVLNDTIAFDNIQKAVNTNAESVTILQNVTENVTLEREENESFTLNLGEYTMDGTITVPYGVNLTIKGTSTENNITLAEPENEEYAFEAWYTTEDFESGTKVADNKVTTATTEGTTYYAKFGKPIFVNEKDAGYYTAENEPNSEKTIGEIAFRSLFENYADYNITKFGFFIYKTAQSAQPTLTSNSDLADSKGYFMATVTNVPVDDAVVYAMPYAQIGNKVYYGETAISAASSEMNKWLGVKEAE